MISIKLSDKHLLDQSADCIALFLEEGFVLPKDLQARLKPLFPKLLDLFKEYRFTGKVGSLVTVPTVHNNKLVQCLFIGIGKSSNRTLYVENYRRAIGQMVRQAGALRCTHVTFAFPDASLFNVTQAYLAQHTATILLMAAYHFDDFLSDPERKGISVQDVTLSYEGKDKKAIQQAIDDGICIGKAVNQTRHWIDLPPSVVTPQYLVQQARTIAKKNDLKITVFNEQQVNEMGMGGLAAVSRGSEIDGELIILEYKTKKKNAPTIAYVGKGITFDSGGLSLKPADYMENMKDDMSGAAAVISVMEAIAEFQPDVNVIGLAPVAENLPSGKATKPGDIVRFYNGKTAEIKNTDAEGRLILADALSYAVKHYKLDAIIDIATLTGACAYFLGAFYTGMLSCDDALVAKVQEAADKSGERIWRLPLDEDYKAAIRNPVADLSNTGLSRYKSGTITAAWFLHSFVGDVPWVHFDIAGTAYDVPDIPYYRQGATGASVRMLIELARDWKK